MSRRRDPLTVDRLRMLTEVAREGTIAGGARGLGLTPSAVSQQLSALERETGVALLDRAGNQVAFTAAGHALVRHAHRVLFALEGAAADLDRLRGVVGGPFRVAAVASAASTVVSEAVVELRTTHPDLDVTVVDAEPRRSLDRLARGDADVAVVDEYEDGPRPVGAGNVSVELLREPLVAVVPLGWGSDRDGSGTSNVRAVSLNELSTATWVMAPADAACGAAVRSACAAAGFEPRVRWETDDLLAHLDHVAAGHGVAVLPRLAVHAGVAAVEVRPLADRRLARRLLAVHRAAAVPRPAVAAFVTALRARCSGRVGRTAG